MGAFFLLKCLFDFKISDQGNTPYFIPCIPCRSALQCPNIVQVLMVCEIALFVLPVDMAHSKVLTVFHPATLDEDELLRTVRRVDKS